MYNMYLRFCSGWRLSLGRHRFLTLLLRAGASTLLTPCATSAQPSPAMVANIDGIQTTRFTATIIPADDPARPRTYGYDIRANGQLLIHQPSVPGNRGFTTTTRARKAAAVVLAKLRRGQMPPTVTLAELKFVGAL